MSDGEMRGLLLLSGAVVGSVVLHRLVSAGASQVGVPVWTAQLLVAGGAIALGGALAKRA